MKPRFMLLFVAILGIAAACPPAPRAESKIKSEELSTRLLNTLRDFSDGDLTDLTVPANYTSSSINEPNGVSFLYYRYCQDHGTLRCARYKFVHDVRFPADSLGKACLGVVPVNGVDSIVDLSAIQAGGSLTDSEINKAAFFAALQRAAAWMLGQRAHDRAEAQEAINRKRAQEALDRAKALAGKYCPEGKCALPN